MNDLSVNYGVYVSMNSSVYEKHVPIQDLRYSGVQVPPQNHTNPEKIAMSWIERDEYEEALSTSLDVVENIDLSRRINYYVIYGVVDLMNYHYTSQDTTGKVVSE